MSEQEYEISSSLLSPFSVNLLKKYNNFEENQNNDDKIFEHDKIIEQLEQMEVLPCVVIDFINGKIQRCSESTKLKQLHNLFGTWQVDRDAIKEVNGFNQGVIQWHQCISCNKFITFFSRGIGCTSHSWHLNEWNIQVPCIGQYTCEALRACPPLCGHIYHHPGRRKSATTCTTEKLHIDDTTKELKHLGNWLINIAQIENNDVKKNILTKTFETLLPRG
ncbi:hypothetical protein Glove_57g83 [Diversispora epigaea]|uniref:Uncharacterized protein n=1 Tax=Diversispora epigaea TaxID=1348612 RepID=A0A397JEM3_9GLOM|nr:hypothetical protein Glove_57g83 [Diversispora epigaea]